MKIKSSWTEALDGFPDSWDGYCANPEVEARMHWRVSALLGPDGEPLRVGIERPKLGFDLTPRKP